MPTIDIRRKHGRTLKAAKTAVDKTAAAIARKFALASQWDGNTLKFSRAGVNGQIHVDKAEIHVKAELGFLFGALKPLIETEIESQLDKSFG